MPVEGLGVFTLMAPIVLLVLLIEREVARIVADKTGDRVNSGRIRWRFVS